MLCALADILNDTNLYNEAWEISHHKCTRAQRTLGKRKFDQENFLESIEHYKKALEINPLYPNAWFTLGCAYMRLKNWESACFSFQKLIFIDSNLPEAWNNLAASQMSLGNYSEAYDALAHGIKYDRNNWKMFENLLILSIKLQKFFTAIECIQNLLNMRQTKLFDSDLFEVLNRIAEGHEKKLEQVYVNLINVISVNSGVWHCYANFIEENIGLDSEFNYYRVVDLRTKACRAAASQELDKNNAEKIEFLAKQLNMAYLKIDDKKLQFEGSLYLKSLSKKIKDVLGRDPNINEN